MEPHGQARGTIITPRWGEHPVPEDQFTHGQGRGPLGTGIDIDFNLYLLVEPVNRFFRKKEMERATMLFCSSRIEGLRKACPL